MKCVSSNIVLTSNPPKLQCENCSKVWSIESEIPECPVEEDNEEECQCACHFISTTGCSCDCNKEN